MMVGTGTNAATDNAPKYKKQISYKHMHTAKRRTAFVRFRGLIIICRNGNDSENEKKNVSCAIRKQWFFGNGVKFSVWPTYLFALLF